ncbi:hypothetical protein SUGI_0333000 [Cryptomeria japonica]|nr:hypothetical protein SUGI_0333000 [Cryptomeria japonica]
MPAALSAGRPRFTELYGRYAPGYSLLRQGGRWMDRFLDQVVELGLDSTRGWEGGGVLMVFIYGGGGCKKLFLLVALRREIGWLVKSCVGVVEFLIPKELVVL